MGDGDGGAACLLGAFNSSGCPLLGVPEIGDGRMGLVL